MSTPSRSIHPGRRRYALGAVLAIAAALVVTGAARAVGPASDVARVELELDAVVRTRKALGVRLTEREAALTGRVRALYKLTRAGTAPLWLDAAERGALANRRAAARRFLVRDLEERQILRAEIADAAVAERRLADELSLLAGAGAPVVAYWSMRQPTPGAIVGLYGARVDAATQARLVRRGVEFGAAPGAPAVAPFRGRVVHAGPLRGLGEVVVLDRGDGVMAVVGGLASLSVSVGDELTRSTPLGAIAGTRVYFELRRHGRPVDPTLFFE